MSKKGTLIAAMAAGFLGAAVGAPAAAHAGDDVKCAGVNECKGKAACHGMGNACAGQNACKGKGWIKLSEKDCKAKGGKVLKDEKKGDKK